MCVYFIYIVVPRIRKKAIRDLKQIKDSTALFDKQQITEILMVSYISHVILLKNLITFFV